MLLLYLLFSLSMLQFFARICVACRHFCFPMWLFQGLVACRNLTLTVTHKCPAVVFLSRILIKFVVSTLPAM